MAQTAPVAIDLPKRDAGSPQIGAIERNEHAPDTRNRTIYE